jgi:Rieske Fe-S protein
MTDVNTLVSRRQFCAGACASCAALATFVTGCGGDSPTSPSGGSVTTLPTLSGQFSGSTVKVTTAGTALNDVGGAALVDSVAGKFLVSKSGATSFIAIDAVCTHEGCTVTGANDSGYVCPCHGSRYDRTGHVTNGPAKANLRQYGTSFADGVVSISV